MGSGKRSEFLCSDKEEKDCDIGLDLKMQLAAESYPSLNKMMTIPPNESSVSGFAGCASSGAGVIFGASSGAVPTVQRTPLPFFPSDSSFRSWGGRAPFTEVQKQELERQTIIYKYIMASMPVPPELLVPISEYPSEIPLNAHFQDQTRGKKSLELRFASSTDPEPWRCRRTDGKKWRCSRDVAPDQKYCERHTHKGRPSRSRKPVESLSVSQSRPTTIAASACPLDLSAPTTMPYQKSSFLNQTDLMSPSQYNQTRYPDWFMKREAVLLPTAALYQHWDQMAQCEHSLMRENCTALDHKDSYFPSQSKSLMGVEQAGRLNEQSCLSPRQFLDAWSVRECKGGNISEITGKYGISSAADLTLSMSGEMDDGDGIGGAGRLGTGLMDSDRDSDGCERTGPSLNWMSSGVSGASWMSPPPGGPLAEALCLGASSSAKGSAAAASSEVSPHGCSCSSTASSSKSSHGDGGHGFK
ncbi:hypothetical protein Nepgr_011436 [Nepenthes gracilis]|uniref:Growth-regulating factor n=1 Tax=Nepenthes gracilis TaxID=150966 RepID=A0AAD3SF63_NEPGR|nr:hypothetical protein Nepgr_011436 [Nepenthes gracilis]